MHNAMIGNDLDDDPFPRTRSNPTFGTPRRFPNQTQDDTFMPASLGPSSMFQRAREVDIGGSPSFVNGTLQNVYYYNYNRGTGNLAQVSSVELAARRSERLVKELEDEVHELNQLLQEKSEELARVEDTANWQEAEVEKLNQLLEEKAEELASLKEWTAALASVEGATHWQRGGYEKKIRILEAQVSGMTVDVNQQKERYEKEIRDLQEKVHNLVEDLNQLEEKHKEEIRSLQAEVCDLIEMKAKCEEEIRGLKAKALRMDLFQGQQGREHKEEIERFEAKVSGREDVGNQQMQKYKGEIECFKARISTLEAWLFSMEHVAVTEHKQEIKRLEGIYEREIQRLEAIVADMGKPEKEGDRFQIKASSMEQVAKHPETRQAKDPTKRAIKSGQPQQAQATSHSSTATDQMSDSSDLGTIIKKERKKSLFNIFNTSASGKQINNPSPQAVVPKADRMPVTDAMNLVKALNAQIEETALLLSDAFSYLGPPATYSELEIAFDGLHHYLGPWLYRKLRKFSEPDPSITQITLQTGLANACSSVVNDSPFWYNGSILPTLYRRMTEREGQAIADERRAKTLRHFALSQYEDANKTYLTEVVLKLVTVAVGGSPESSEGLLSQHNQQVDEIARIAAKLHKTIDEDVTPMELITYTVPCDTEFDASQMEDAIDTSGTTSHGKVICTLDMGLLCRKRVEPRMPRGSIKDWGVTMKAKLPRWRLTMTSGYRTDFRRSEWLKSLNLRKCHR